jgi:glycosyl transferase family 2
MSNGDSRTNPRVSVIMTAYQDLRFIDAAVNSILAQTYANFELVIFDDGTNQPDVFTRLAALDPRIRVIHSEQNLGAYAAANRAIADARGEIIARLDADDLAKPARLDRLVAALDADRELGLIGSWADRISEAGEARKPWQTPASDLLIRWTILFLNPFCHSTVAFRRSCFDAVGGYNSTMRTSGDYELWWKMLEICRAENIPEALAYYRINSRGITAAKSLDRRQPTDPLRSQSWRRLGVAYEPQLVPHLVDFLSGARISDPDVRLHTYQTALTILMRFFLTPQSPLRGKDAESARELKSEIIGRVLADTSITFVARIQLWTLCWQIDRGLAAAMLPGMLFKAVVDKSS